MVIETKPQIEMVLSGLIVGGHVRRKGEIVDKPDHLPDSPQEQMEKFKGKVYYVVVDSPWDKKVAKDRLSKQEEDIEEITNIVIDAQFSDEGARLEGDVKPDNVITEDDLPNILPDYYDSEDIDPEDGMKMEIGDIQEELDAQEEEGQKEEVQLNVETLEEDEGQTEEEEEIEQPVKTKKRSKARKVKK